MKHMVRSLKRRWWLMLLVPLLAAGAFVVWAQSPAEPMSDALEALETGAQVDGVVVSTEEWLAFQPAGSEARTGLVLYPGGRVDPRAYAPAARAISDEGYLVVIVPMPLNLAFFAPDAVDQVMEAFPDVDRWAVGGHSLGGAMAARYVDRHPGSVDGLVLWAAYPAAGDDLSIRRLEVVSIYGTRDGLATRGEIAASRPLLPPQTEWVRIEGGNHAQFGWYGSQRGDNPATISRESQQQTIVAATVRLLERVSGSPAKVRDRRGTGVWTRLWAPGRWSSRQAVRHRTVSSKELTL